MNSHNLAILAAISLTAIMITGVSTGMFAGIEHNIDGLLEDLDVDHCVPVEGYDKGVLTPVHIGCVSGICMSDEFNIGVGSLTESSDSFVTVVLDWYPGGPDWNTFTYDVYQGDDKEHYVDDKIFGGLAPAGGYTNTYRPWRSGGTWEGTGSVTIDLEYKLGIIQMWGISNTHWEMTWWGCVDHGIDGGSEI